MPEYFKTRQWKHPEGYKFLAPWTNAVLLRFLVRKFTETLPRQEHRTKTQLDDAGRSVVSNIEEGYKRPTTKEYLNFIGFSQASLEEIKGLLRQAHQDGFLKSRPNSTLADLGINLKELKGLLKDSKGEIPLEILYPPLKSLNSPLSSSNEPLTSSNPPLTSSNAPLKSSKDFPITYEMFLELINKTDWLFRQTVKSLETKMSEEVPMSARDRWERAEWEREREEQRNFDREIREMMRREGKIFTMDGYLPIEEAKRRGLPEIEIP